VAAELLAHARDSGALREGMIVLADKGLEGRAMEHYAAEQIGVLLARPDRKDERRRFGAGDLLVELGEELLELAGPVAAVDGADDLAAGHILGRVAGGRVGRGRAHHDNPVLRRRPQS
jgi:hypothetical protein